MFADLFGKSFRYQQPDSVVLIDRRELPDRRDHHDKSRMSMAFLPSSSTPSRMPTTTIHVDALQVNVHLVILQTNQGLPSRLFDMDGTLVHSMAGVIGAWELFATKYPGLNVKEILGCAFLLSFLTQCDLDRGNSYSRRAHCRMSPKVL
jgi:hypothetical protein